MTYMTASQFNPRTNSLPVAALCSDSSSRLIANALRLAGAGGHAYR